MKHGKTFFGRLINKIGNVFASVFKGAEETFENLPPKLQDALKLGSGLIAMINQHSANTPEFILDAIKKLFPLFDEEHFHSSLQAAASGIAGLAERIEGKDLVQTIGTIRDYLKELKILSGKEWAKKSSFLAQAVAFVIAPAETKFSMIVSLIDTVYHKFFKKD